MTDSPAPKRLLILDLNGTILDRDEKAWAESNYRYLCKVNRHYIFKRPFLDEFLNEAFQHYSVGVWSSASEVNTKAMVDAIFQGKPKLEFVLDRKYCTLDSRSGARSYDTIKDLRKIWESREHNPHDTWGARNTVILDDTPSKTAYNIYNAVHIPSFSMSRQDPGSDEQLLLVLPYLRELSFAEDVRDFIHDRPYQRN